MPSKEIITCLFAKTLPLLSFKVIAKFLPAFLPLIFVLTVVVVIALATIVVATLTELVPLVLMDPPCGMLMPDPSFKPAISKSKVFAPSTTLLSLMSIGLEGARTPLSDSSSNNVIELATTLSFALVTVLFAIEIAGLLMDKSSVPFVAVAFMSTSPLFATKFNPLMLTLFTSEAMLKTGFPSPAVIINALSPTMLMSLVMLMSETSANTLEPKSNTPPAGVSSISF